MSKNSITPPISLSKDERGSVTILFGLSVVVLTLFGGLAMDIGRVYSTKSKIGAAVDAAALAAAKAIRLEGMSEAEATAHATAIFQQNMISSAAHWTNIRSLTVTVDRTTGRAIVNVDTTVRAHFAGLAGVPEFRVPATASALFEGGDIEVSLQLDLTGSMCNAGPAPCTNHPKIQGLKDATKDLIDIVMPDNPGNARVRVAFAPFTAGVNLGPYQAAVTGNRTTAKRCVYERLSSANQATDREPTGTDRYMVTSDLQAAPHNVANPRGCPSAQIVPLTDRKQFLKTTVDSYVADGYTGGHNGTAWAWNLISPNFASVWPAESAPAAYADANTQKVAVLMTDGEYNTMHGRGWNAQQVSSTAVDTCNAMKAAGVRVYTVGFALGGNQTAINTLADCASSAGDFFQAATPEELRSAFRTIANNIVRLRLTN